LPYGDTAAYCDATAYFNHDISLLSQ
jgi:hypothetical protein